MNYIGYIIISIYCAISRRIRIVSQRTNIRNSESGFTIAELMYVFIALGVIGALIALIVCGFHFIFKHW